MSCKNMKNMKNINYPRSSLLEGKTTEDLKVCSKHKENTISVFNVCNENERCISLGDFS